jgi:hypothetical protein
MADVVFKTVGGTSPTPNYTTISSFESNEQRDLVSADEIAEARLRAVTFDESVTFASANWTTDSTRFIRITYDPNSTTPAGVVPDGQEGTLPFWNETGSGHCCEMENDAEFIGLEMKAVDKNSGECIRIGAADVEVWVKSCIFRDSTYNANDAIYMDNDDGITLHVWNCFFWAFDRAAIHSQHSTGAWSTGRTINVYHCTIVDCPTDTGDSTYHGGLSSYQNATGTVTWNVKGHLGEQNKGSNRTMEEYGSAGTHVWNIYDTIVSDAPLASLSTGTTSNVTESATFQAADTPTTGDRVMLQNLTTEDLHLRDTAGNDALEYASDLGDFSTDIEGDTRATGIWDAGADQVSTSAGGVQVDVTVQSVSVVQPADSVSTGSTISASPLSVQADQQTATAQIGVTHQAGAQSVEADQQPVTTQQGITHDAGVLSVVADQQTAEAQTDQVISVATLDVPVVQPAVTAGVSVQLDVATQVVQAVQPAVDTYLGWEETVAVQSVPVSQPAVDTYLGWEESVATLSLPVVQPATTISGDAIYAAATLDVPVVQPATTQTGDATYNAATLDVPVVQPPVEVILPGAGDVQVDVAALDVGAQQQAVTLSTDQILSAATQVIQADQQAVTIQEGAGFDASTLSVAAQQQSVTLSLGATIDVLEQVVEADQQPITVITPVGQELIVRAPTQHVEVQQQPIRVILPSDQVAWLHDGTRLISLQTMPLIASFGNTSPYGADAWATIDGLLTTSDIGYFMRKDYRWVAMSVHSDEGLGSPPTTSCSVGIYVNGTLEKDFSWDGTNYHFSVTYSFDGSAGDHVSFYYTDDAPGQSAGKVIVVGEYRWRASL